MSPQPGLASEISRRQSLASKLEDYLKARPGEWLTMDELAKVGGLGGWRTRLSELGRRTVDPLTIEHNKMNGAASRHRYLPWKPQGPSADQYREMRLF